MTSPDPTTIPTILRLVENIWQGQPNLSLVAILDILCNHGLDWDSTPSDTIAVLRAYLDDFPTTLSEDTLASGRTFRIRTTSPHLGIHHLRASHSRPRQRPHDVGIRAPHPRRNPPTTAYRRPPLRRHHAHRQPRRSHPRHRHESPRHACALSSRRPHARAEQCQYTESHRLHNKESSERIVDSFRKSHQICDRRALCCGIAVRGGCGFR
ncbi:hypothetical protein NY051_07605 [Corynebacterium diphtheriae bv. gravis]|nr:hypothetical protein NY051_07605 [Corynebacterium diphtheriae bv. gravis]